MLMGIFGGIAAPSQHERFMVSCKERENDNVEHGAWQRYLGNDSNTCCRRNVVENKRRHQFGWRPTFYVEGRERRRCAGVTAAKVCWKEMSDYVEVIHFC